MESTEIGREAKVYESLWSGGNVVWKDDLTSRDSGLSVATCMCHIELYLMHIQVKG